MTNLGSADLQGHFYMGLIGAAFFLPAAWAMPTILPFITMSWRELDEKELKAKIARYRFGCIVVGICSLLMAIANFGYR